MEHPTPRYTFLAFQLNMLLDQGITVSLDEVRARISDGSLLDWLEAEHRRPPVHLDLSLYDAGERRTILKVFQSLTEDIDADRKLGVTRNGIALCLAYCVQVLQSPDVYDDYRFDE